MENIEEWLNKLFIEELPSEIEAIVFNLYENNDYHWSIEMTGTDNFDLDDSDWACDELYNRRKENHTWYKKTSWEEVLIDVIKVIETYLKSGKFSHKLKSYEGIGVGFVDGDINVIYTKKINH